MEINRDMCICIMYIEHDRLIVRERERGTERESETERRNRGREKTRVREWLKCIEGDR